MTAFDVSMDARLRELAAAYTLELNANGPERIGDYRVLRQIGAGGMGSVYLAERDDGQFDHRIAIKVVSHGLERPWAESRFYYERHVLAKLAHPNIARLLGGGSTPEGTPYLLMEYIDGQPIDRYCEEHRLTVVERVELFLRVCDAVSYAHRNLVVHRDIKPSNLLVTQDGTPKLLDFGIARILDEDNLPTGCSDTLHLMTPRYASPEQMRGDAITTATDIYSLGLVLYELVTGVSPFGGGGLEARKPSEIATSRLPRDLDNVILMAISAEPECRYSSVEQFASDLRLCLAGLPVIARQGTVGYRVSKFVRRHKAGVTTALLLVLSLLGGVSATAWQARRVAEQVARTERRFAQFRKLANAFLFDFHDRIKTLKDVSEARELVLNTGIEYVDGLARDANDDPILSRELARAYEKIGDLQGYRSPSAMRQAGPAITSYRKAVALLHPAFAAGTTDIETLTVFARTVCSLGEVIERSSGNAGEALTCYREGLESARRIPQYAHRGRTLRLIDRASKLAVAALAKMDSAK